MNVDSFLSFPGAVSNFFSFVTRKKLTVCKYLFKKGDAMLDANTLHMVSFQNQSFDEREIINISTSISTS